MKANGIKLCSRLCSAETRAKSCTLPQSTKMRTPSAGAWWCHSFLMAPSRILLTHTCSRALKCTATKYHVFQSSTIFEKGQAHPLKWMGCSKYDVQECTEVHKNISTAWCEQSLTPLKFVVVIPSGLPQAFLRLCAAFRFDISSLIFYFQQLNNHQEGNQTKEVPGNNVLCQFKMGRFCLTIEKRIVLV